MNCICSWIVCIPPECPIPYPIDSGRNFNRLKFFAASKSFPSNSINAFRNFYRCKFPATYKACIRNGIFQMFSQFNRS